MYQYEGMFATSSMTLDTGDFQRRLSSSCKSKYHMGSDLGVPLVENELDLQHHAKSQRLLRW